MKTAVVFCLSLSFLLAGAAASALEPCCNITDVDARTGVVTVADAETGQMLQFKASASMLRSLKVGQAVQVDYRAQKVSVPGVRGAFAMINVRPAEPVGEPRPAEPVGEPRPAEPVGEPMASAQAMTNAGSSNPLGSKPGRPPMKVGRGTENPGRGECEAKGSEWRCTTVSTGSSPGPEDDVLSCVCINPQREGPC